MEQCGEAGRGRRRAGGAALGLLLAAALAGCAERVNVSSTGEQANGPSGIGNNPIAPAISAGGRFVAFVSRATNLVPGDTNQVPDVFVRDRRYGVTERVNVSSAGAQADHGTFAVLAISPRGWFVAFDSVASNLVPGDTNGSNDVFLHDRRTGVTERISADNAGSTGVAVSAGGRFVAFDDPVEFLPPRPAEVFVRDRTTGALEKVDVDSSEQPLRNEDGTVRSGFAPAMSSDGNFVAFKVAAPPPGGGGSGEEIFVRDRAAGTTESLGRVRSLSDGSRPSISGDGRIVAFETLLAIQDIGRPIPLLASFGIRVHDRATGESELISPASDQETLRYPALSADGRHLAYTRGPSIPGASQQGQIVVRDLRTGSVELVSENPAGDPANGPSHRPAISAPGRFVAFISSATDLVVGDTNDQPDVFLVDRGP